MTVSSREGFPVLKRLRLFLLALEIPPLAIYRCDFSAMCSNGALDFLVCQRPVIVEISDHCFHERFGETDSAVLVAEMVVEDGKRKLLRARPFIRPLEPPFGELLDFVMLAERAAVDRYNEAVDTSLALVGFHGLAAPGPAMIYHEYVKPLDPGL